MIFSLKKRNSVDLEEVVNDLKKFLDLDDEDECDGCCEECGLEDDDMGAAIEEVINSIDKALGILAEKRKAGKEPKKCPICGSSVHVLQSEDNGKWYISCGYCPVETLPAFESEEEAIDFWNDREIAEGRE